mgnify:FL=1
MKEEQNLSQSEEKEVVNNLEEEFVEDKEVVNQDETQSNDEMTNEAPSELELLQKQLDEETNRHLRLRADYENFKRRAQLDRESAEKYKSQGILSNLLPVLDNFERAM